MMETDVQRHERAFRKTIEKSHQDISRNFLWIVRRGFVHNARKFQKGGSKDEDEDEEGNKRNKISF